MQHYTNTWIGLSDLNKESSFYWSDGTPLAFLNWRDSEPNGGNGENCGEFKVDAYGGQWNDYTCYTPLSFVCEKKGSNYNPPQPPPKPEAKCPENWRKIGDRCIYNSADFAQRAANWTEAKATCHGFHVGSTLISIRSQEDVDALYQIVYGNTYIGGSDAETEDTWLWDDGEPFDFKNFKEGEPNGGQGENCLEMDYDMKWNDVDCGAKYDLYFMCSTPISIHN